MGYDAVPCTVKLYDGSTKDGALIYVLNPEKVKEYWGKGDNDQEQQKNREENKPPTERYITIIIEGCEHYGVKQEHINYLKSLEYQPRKDPSEFETMDVPNDAPTMTMADVEAADGVDGNPIYTTCNGKVLSHIGLPKMFLERLQKAKSKGLHSYEVMINSMLYDPLFGVVKQQEDVSKLCAASTEDQIVTWNKLGRGSSSTVVVGLIDLPYKD